MMMSQLLVTACQSADDPKIRVECCRGDDGNKPKVSELSVGCSISFGANWTYC
jgi:hypothetical protein